ncbi:MAG: D-glycero-beta-D-manno-heptose 1,7-bisphosphate 7-phosphatase [Lachnospiraceae bacterium]|nr:D-glycero-beta-D-manno-heptose 1,7-bisphosphate 7-phosphatase [Lachnospiraceae bacterium]
MDRIVFLDRDGTINVEKCYLYKPEEFEFIEGVPEAIRLLNEAGYKVAVITNQAGVARGYYAEEDVERLHRYINERLAEKGAHIDAFFYCPHHPEKGIGKYKKECGCRKPGIGMFLQAEEFFDVDKENSWMIGDKHADIEAGKNYGVRTILVRTGYGKEEERWREYDFVTRDLMSGVIDVIFRIR